MELPIINAFAIPTGGAVGLKLTTAVSGTVTLSRAVSGSGGLGSFTTLYTGVPLSNTGETCFYLDIGDASPGPLIGGTLYVYNLTDVNGTVASPPIQTPSEITLEEAPYTDLIIGLLQGGINTATRPPGIKKAQVLNAMPLAGLPTLPTIFVNPEAVSQEEIPVGVDNETAGDLIQPGRANIWTQTEQDHHMFRITVLSLNAIERNYYRTLIIGILRVAVAYAFSQFGADSSRSSEAVSYQEVDEPKSLSPGFYAADVLFSFTAVGNVKITTNYGLIERITGDFEAVLFDTTGDPVDVQVEVPTL